MYKGYQEESIATNVQLRERRLMVVEVEWVVSRPCWRKLEIVHFQMTGKLN